MRKRACVLWRDAANHRCILALPQECVQQGDRMDEPGHQRPAIPLCVSPLHLSCSRIDVRYPVPCGRKTAFRWRCSSRCRVLRAWVKRPNRSTTHTSCLLQVRESVWNRSTALPSAPRRVRARQVAGCPIRGCPAPLRAGGSRKTTASLHVVEGHRRCLRVRSNVVHVRQRSIPTPICSAAQRRRDRSGCVRLGRVAVKAWLKQ